MRPAGTRHGDTSDGTSGSGGAGWLGATLDDVARTTKIGNAAPLWDGWKPVMQTTNHTHQSNTHMKKETKLDANGGSYYVISAFGWAQDANPFRAFMRLAESGNVTGSFPKAKDFKSEGSLAESSDDGIMVYYVADDSKCVGFEWYRPVDKDGNPVGVPVYGGETNCNSIAELLKQVIQD